MSQSVIEKLWLGWASRNTRRYSPRLCVNESDAVLWQSCNVPWPHPPPANPRGTQARRRRSISRSRDPAHVVITWQIDGHMLLFFMGRDSKADSLVAIIGEQLKSKNWFPINFYCSLKMPMFEQAWYCEHLPLRTNDHKFPVYWLLYCRIVELQ